MPAQSGSSTVLERMRRGYSREAYLDLIHHVRQLIPSVSLSSDFICGFCGETDEEFEDTLTLMLEVKYNMAFLFAYSLREVSCFSCSRV
jgi:tRNA A37 methylthiotransferase MiaB